MTVAPTSDWHSISGEVHLVIDFDLGEIQHVLGYLESGPMLFTPDGRYLLAVDNSTYVAPLMWIRSMF